MTKTLTYVTLAVVLVMVIAGGYFFPKANTAFGASPAGTTLSTAKIAEQVTNVATDTQFAILNTDANDRSITGVDIFLTAGAATSSLYTVQCATSSVATGLNGSTNYIFNSTFPVTYGTTTANSNFYVSSSSPGIVSTTTSVTGSPAANYVNNFVRNWKANSYLICKLVNSGTGQNNLFDPAMTGFISFSYKGQ